MKGRHLLEDVEASENENADIITAMTPQVVIDSHIHLWPESMSNEDGHAWMTPGMPLAKEQLLSDYFKVAQQQGTTTGGGTVVEGVIYVETDVRYDKPESTIPIQQWAKGPLDEIRFLRNVVEGQYSEREAEILQGIVAWAPMDQPTSILEEWLQIAKEIAGPSTWSLVKGFRFLLQFITIPKTFEDLVLGPNFIPNLKVLGQRNFSFDVGVDQRSAGVWQLEIMAKAMSKAHEGVRQEEKTIFIINHLCKPDFRHDSIYHARWRRAVEIMAREERTYMKLSGAFSELPGGLGSAKGIAAHMGPWIRHVLDCYSARRVMFGSDWPVCNVKKRDDGAWGAWRDVVETILDDEAYQLAKEDKERIWRGTAREAYRLG